MIFLDEASDDDELLDAIREKGFALAPPNAPVRFLSTSPVVAFDSGFEESRAAAPLRFPNGRILFGMAVLDLPLNPQPEPPPPALPARPRTALLLLGWRSALGRYTSAGQAFTRWFSYVPDEAARAAYVCEVSS